MANTRPASIAIFLSFPSRDFLLPYSLPTFPIPPIPNPSHPLGDIKSTLNMRTTPDAIIKMINSVRIIFRKK